LSRELEFQIIHKTVSDTLYVMLVWLEIRNLVRTHTVEVEVGCKPRTYIRITGLHRKLKLCLVIFKIIFMYITAFRKYLSSKYSQSFVKILYMYYTNIIFVHIVNLGHPVLHQNKMGQYR
jgi:hypothetical protein